MIAVAVLGAGALLVTIYATEKPVRVDQQLPETVEATNAELLRVIETLERTNGRLEQAVDTATARLVDLQRKRGLTR